MSTAIKVGKKVQIAATKSTTHTSFGKEGCTACQSPKSITTPMRDNRPANQVAFLIGWRKKSHAKIAARNPFNAGKKATLVAVVYFKAIAMVNNARQSELPIKIPRLTTSLVINLHEQIMIIMATGASVIISKYVKMIGSIRSNASFATA